MTLKVGDKVLFKKEKDHGEIVMLIGNFKAIVLNSQGFKIPVLLEDLISYYEDNQELNTYHNQDCIKDQESNVSIPKSIKQRKSSNVKKIDLHIDCLIEDYDQLSNSEIIAVQIKHCELMLNDVLDSYVEELIIIHGIGIGVLSQRIHDLLKDYNLRFYLSQDGGSTIVLL